MASAVAAAPYTPFATRARPTWPRRWPSLETPQLSVVIVNFCQWKNTARLTRQLRRSEAVRRGAAEIVIVDNHSPKHVLRRKLGKLSGVSLYTSRSNTGFATAVNRGSKVSHGEWVLLLNPDVTVPEGFLDRVLETAQRFPAIDPGCGVIGFQMRHPDGSRQASAGPFPTLTRTIGGLLRPRASRKCQHHSLDRRQQVPWVTGGCLLVRRDCFEELGGLDETYFLYYEDVDFCRRAREAGWSIWYEPQLRVTHHFPLHTRRVPAPLRLVTRHALLTYARRHWSKWQSGLLSRIVWTEALVREKMAKRHDDTAAVECYRQLRAMVGELQDGRDEATQARIAYAAKYLNAIASANDGKTE